MFAESKEEARERVQKWVVEKMPKRFDSKNLEEVFNVMKTKIERVKNLNEFAERFVLEAKEYPDEENV
jgi:predicted DNA-binding protein (UPF0278 family)